MKRTLLAIGATAYLVAAVVVSGELQKRANAQTTFIPAEANNLPAARPAPPPAMVDEPVPGLNYVTIANGVIVPVPGGAAFIDITGPTDLMMGTFPEGAILTLAIRNPENFPVAMVYKPENVFQLEQFGPSQFGRYLLHVQNVRGEIWITK